MKTEPNDLIDKVDYTENPRSGVVYHKSKGLTKREHFAGLAMQGILAAGRAGVNAGNLENISHWAVSHADALIAELNKETP